MLAWGSGRPLPVLPMTPEVPDVGGCAWSIVLETGFARQDPGPRPWGRITKGKNHRWLPRRKSLSRQSNPLSPQLIIPSTPQNYRSLQRTQKRSRWKGPAIEKNRSVKPLMPPAIAGTVIRAVPSKTGWTPKPSGSAVAAAEAGRTVRPWVDQVKMCSVIDRISVSVPAIEGFGGRCPCATRCLALTFQRWHPTAPREAWW